MNKKTVVGMTLIFVSGMFYLRLIAFIAVMLGGGTIRDYGGNLIKPPPEFFDNGVLLALYGIPFLVSGIYLIKKSY